MKATSPKLLFNNKSLHLILEAFGKSISEDGLIIESATSQPVLTPEGEEIEQSNFAGMKKGSEIFLKGDLLTIMNLAEGKY